MIRRAKETDTAWIRDTAAEVYRQLGDYATIIPSWLEHSGVLAYVEEVDVDGAPRRRGFILLGFYEPDNAAPGEYIADLLAIAIAPPYQRQGVGRTLLRYAIHVARLAGRENRVPEIRLTVAETNEAGRRLFLSSGFRDLDEDHGSYEGGQRAIRMSLAL